MQDSVFGDNSWKNDPVAVARQAIDAMMSGKTSIVAGDASTQEAGLLLKQLSDEAKAKRHAEMAKPHK